MRVGILDVAAAGLAAFAILLPSPPPRLEPVYEGKKAELVRPIAEAQADLASGKGRGEAADRLAELLLEAGESDWALRVAAAAAADEKAPDHWRAVLAVSAVHASRLEMKPALEWAEKALAACDRFRESCPPHERVRLDTYATALKAGVESGIDPRLDPRAFDAAIKRKLPTITVRPPRGG